jgi:acyl-CoA thioesterase-1
MPIPHDWRRYCTSKGIPANVINAGVLGVTTTRMLQRVDSAVPKGTNIVILQPGANDLRFGFSKEQRAANTAAMVKRLRARDIPRHRI